MKKNLFGLGLAVFFAIVGVLFVIDSISEANEPKCIKAGCDNQQASGSSYCYRHKPCTGRNASHRSSSYSTKSTGGKSTDSKSTGGKSTDSNSIGGKSTDSKSTDSKSTGSTSKSSTSSSGTSSSYNNKSNSTNNSSSYSSGTKKNTTITKNTYDSYDDGYEDIYMDGDYDYERYNRDSDYADGVDDAMDEFEEDW